jgi:tRNA pseudouridine55 synthase
VLDDFIKNGLLRRQSSSENRRGGNRITTSHPPSLQRDDEISGILVVDKPTGLSSAQAVSRLKRLPGIRKIGHAGTLDPAASGVLICPVNQATRLSRFFLEGTKTYEARMRLGIETDTQDATGKILSQKPIDGISKDQIRAVCGRFVGAITQTPPIFSALKHKGKPLYSYAREGISIIKPARNVFIDHIRIQDIVFPHVCFEVACSSGTYIRTLCADIGKILGCGGHLESLRRTTCGGFTIAEAAPLDALTALSSLAAMGHRLIPMAEALREIPLATADAALADRIKTGKPLLAGDLGFDPGPGHGPPLVGICDDHGRLLSVAAADRDGMGYNYCCVFINP